MTRPYRTLGEMNEARFRELIANTGGPAVEETPTQGIMGSRFSRGARQVPVQNEQPTEQSTPATSFLEAFARALGMNADDPEEVAGAVTTASTTEGAGSVDEFTGLTPLEQLLGRDQTRAALGEATPEFEETASRLTSDLMRDFDLTETQAAALVGNLAVESANFSTLQEIDPVVPGSRGGYGFAQWTGDRRRAFESWAQENGLDPASYEANYGYLRKELSERDDVIGNIGRNTIDTLREIDDINEATSFVMDYYLRPGIEHEGRRQASAQRILGLMARQ